MFRWTTQSLPSRRLRQSPRRDRQSSRSARNICAWQIKEGKVRSQRPSRAFPVSQVAFILLASQLCVVTAFAQTHPKASELLQQMTLEEKIAELSQLPG